MKNKKTYSQHIRCEASFALETNISLETAICDKLKLNKVS